MTRDERQEQYELRRRSRLLGLAIDQSLRGVQNIITFSDPKFWDNNSEWASIVSKAEDILVDLMALERKMDAINPEIYATLLGKSQETKDVTDTPQSSDSQGIQ
jgi:hypothetical protein